MSRNLVTLKPLDVYREYRAKIESEYDYFNRRLTWLMGSQAFLIAAYVALIFPNQDPKGLGPSLSCVVAFVGLFSCVSVLYGLYAAYLAIQNLEGHYKMLDDRYRKPLRDLGVEMLMSDPTIRRLGRVADFGLPNMFVVLWSALIGLSIHLTQQFSYPSQISFLLGGGLAFLWCLYRWNSTVVFWIFWRESQSQAEYMLCLKSLL